MFKKKCEFCSQILELSIFCNNCQKLQENLKINHFEIFSQPVHFEINKQDLEKKYLELQSLTHPDLFINENANQRNLALQHNMKINSAFECLKSDLLRAEYLLELENIFINEEKKNALKPSQEILIMQMQKREELEDVQSLQEIDLIEQRAQEKISDLKNKFSKTYSEKDFLNAAKVLIELKYENKFLQDLKIKKRSLK